MNESKAIIACFSVSENSYRFIYHITMILKSLLCAYKRRRRKRLFLRIYFERLRHPGQDMDSVFGDTCSDLKGIAEVLDYKGGQDKDTSKIDADD